MNDVGYMKRSVLIDRQVSGAISVVVFLFMVTECIVNPDMLSYLEYVKSASFEEIRAPFAFFGFGGIFAYELGSFLGSFIPFSKKKQDP